jgi:hypothetical protein
MRTQLTKITLAATLAFAIAFTLNACSSDSNDDPTPPGGGDLGGLDGNERYQRMKEENKYYNPDNAANERCEAGVVEKKCSLPDGDVWYSELKKACSYISEGPMAGNIYKFEEWKVCGSILYIDSWGRCTGGAYEDKCGEGWANVNTQYCYKSTDIATMTAIYEVKAKLPCGTGFYEPSDNPLYAYERCENNVVEYRCGSGMPGNEVHWYNPKTNVCNGKTGEVVTKAEATCNGKEIDDFGYQMCKDGVIKQECSMFGGEPVWYDPIKEACAAGMVKPKTKCGS